VFEAVSESLAQLRRFLASLPWVASEPSVEASEAWCRNASANFIARRDMPFLVFERDTGSYLGSTGLHRPDWSVPRFEIGYWVRSSRSGKGLVTEAVQALCGEALGHLGARRLDIVTDERNAASRRVAERCGFTLDGVLRNERRGPDGVLVDTCIYSRLA
jgi:RimJ/RimL family protein N-acetyltransferase